MYKPIRVYIHANRLGQLIWDTGSTTNIINKNNIRRYPFKETRRAPWFRRDVPSSIPLTRFYSSGPLIILREKNACARGSVEASIDLRTTTGVIINQLINESFNSQLTLVQSSSSKLLLFSSFVASFYVRFFDQSVGSGRYFFRLSPSPTPHSARLPPPTLCLKHSQ
jgi:hypothetical protein